MRPWLRDPLVHFLALGAVVLGVDAALGPQADEEAPHEASAAAVQEDRSIVVSDAILVDLTTQLTRSLGRPPTPLEREAAVDRWVRTEVLVREARRLQLDRGDPILRERLAQRMALVQQGVLVPPEPTEAQLRALHADLAGELTLPARLTVRQLFVEGADESRAQALAMAWRGGADGVELAASADTPPGGPVLRSRTLKHLERQLGDEVADALLDAKKGEVVVARGERGWHILRVLDRSEGGPLSFEAAERRLRVRWKARWLEAATDEALHTLLQRYTVTRERP